MPPIRDGYIVWIASGSFCEPETVLPLPDGTFLVSNVCDDKSTGTGYLSLIDGQGRLLDVCVVDNPDLTLGLALIPTGGDNTVIVVSIDD